MKYIMQKYKIFILLMALSCSILTIGHTQAADGNYKVKAVFLFKFFKYIDWPPETADQKTICIYGGNPFGGTLDYITKTKLTSGEYKVHYIDDVKELDDCQLVFVNKSVKRVDVLFTSIENKPGILMVSDMNDFAHMGGGNRIC